MPKVKIKFKSVVVSASVHIHNVLTKVTTAQVNGKTSINVKELHLLVNS